VKRPEGFDPPKPTEPSPGGRQQRGKAPKTGKAAKAPKSQSPSKSRAGRASIPEPAAKVVPLVREKSTIGANSSNASDSAASRHDMAKHDRAVAREARAEARRFTRNSRRRRLAVATVLGVVALMIAVLAVAVFSPILALRTIRVEGNSAIPSATVQRALAPQLGTPLALLDDGKIRSELSSIILIRSYVTEVVPPNTLIVRVIERKAIGVLRVGSTYEQVDPAGVVVATSTTASGLPIIEIGKAGVDSAGFAAAVKVLIAMPPSVLAEVASISATTLDNVSLTLNQGSHIIVWGSSAQSDLKAAALAALLKNSNCASQTVLNVTAPLALACGPIQPTATPTPTPTPTPTRKP
jgi:cell division protein FtsQ